MNKKIDDKTLLFYLSEESVIDSWNVLDSSDEKYAFSKKYRTFKQDLIRKVDDAEHTESNKIQEFKNKKEVKVKWYKRISAATAAAVFAIVCTFSVGACALVKFYDIFFSAEDSGEYNYQIKPVDDFMLENAELRLHYIPQGYELSLAHGEKEETGLKKYQEINGNGKFSVCLDSFYAIDESGKSSEIEQIKLGSVPAIVFITNGSVEFNYRIQLHFNDIGQVVSVYGSEEVTLDELKKVAENIELKVIEGESYKAFDDTNGFESYENPLGIKKGIIDEETMAGLGTEVNLSDRLSVKVTDIKYMDNISGLSDTHFICDLSSFIKPDGTFMSYDVVESVWEGNSVVEKKIGVGHIGFAYVTMEITNITKGFLDGEYMGMNIVYQNPQTGDLEYETIGEGMVVTDGAAVYYDAANVSDDPKIHTKLISDFEPEETKVVHLGFLYVLEREEEAYISMRNWIGHQEDCFVKLVTDASDFRNNLDN